MADTVKVQWQAYLGAGSLLLSDQGRVLASIIEDSSACHDALCGTSTRVRNEARYGGGGPESPSPAGRELFLLAMAKHGLSSRDLPPSLSLFKGISVAADGGLTYHPGAGAGAHVTLRAELPLVMSIVNVPHVLDPRPAYTVTPLRVTAWRGRPTQEGDDLWSATPEGERAFLNTAEHLGAQAP